MRIAGVPEFAIETLKSGLDQFLTGLGRLRLQSRHVALENLNVRGGILEAQLDMEDIDPFLGSTGESLDAFFSRLRILLFEDEKPVGSAILSLDESGILDLEHVVLSGAEEVVEGLAVAERTTVNNECEARLVQMPQIYLTALALVWSGTLDSFYILSPPYSEGASVRSSIEFRRFVSDLIEEHRRIFP